MNSSISRIITLAVPFALLLTACASTNKQMEADMQSLQGKLDECSAAQAACGEELKALKAELKASDRQLDMAKRRAEAYKDLSDKLKEAFAGGDMTIIIRNGRLVVQLPNRILFDTGKFEIKSEGVEALDKLAGVLKTVTNRQFLVAGHTDDQPVQAGASFKDNWELSSRRALAATRILVDSGVNPRQLAAAGYGEFSPTVANDSDEHRAQNRRTEIIIMPTLDEIPRLPAGIDELPTSKKKPE